MSLFLELHIVLVYIIFGVVDFRRKSYTCTSLFHFHNVNLHSNLHLLMLIFLVCVLALRYSSSITKQYGSHNLKFCHKTM